MSDELKQLKSVLRSLVVSSPTKMTLTNLLRDYRSMMGQPIPITKFGYRDPLQFLKDRCGDCFLFSGFGTNTVLTPIVPECLKHIDEFVHKQKVSAKDKYKGKRMSINESAIKPSPNLIAKTFETRCNITTGPPDVVREKYKQPPAPAPAPKRNPLPPECDTRPPERKVTPQPNVVKTIDVEPSKTVDKINNNINKYKSMSNLSQQNKENKPDQSLPSKEAYKNFMKSRLPVYESTADLSNESRSYKDSESGSYTSESGQRTLSSTSSSTKATQLEELKSELLEIIRDRPNGVCTTEIMKLYRERYNRELNFSRFGFSSVSVLACGLPGVYTSRDLAGNTRVTLTPPDAEPAKRRQIPRPRACRTTALLATTPGDDDALPWIDFDPDVFPADCMSFSESIPSASLDDVVEGSMLEVMVGEVYSPSHFWMYRLGDEHNIAMEETMDQMTAYYSTGEGAQRTLAVGAVRVGHYCSSVYEQDWHRSLIVHIQNSDTVKVRHVDYGTVDRVPVRKLKPLLRKWGSLPAQALRARLAGVCPAARGRRWPHAAAAAFLRLVQDRRLVAKVVHIDREENILEVFLVDTSTDRDIRIDLELVKAGHADARPATDTDTLPSYLYPLFDALESGATPNYADIHAYLADGIALEYVEDYVRHVPPVLPLAEPTVTPAKTFTPPKPTPRLDNRIPLIPRAFDTAVVTPIVAYDNSTESEEEVNRESEHESVENDSLEDPAETRPLIEWDSPKDETQSDAPEVENEAPVEQSNLVPPSEEARAPSPAPLAPITRAQSQKLLEVSPEKIKPACRAAPRMVPDIRSLQRPEQNAFIGAPLMPAPSVPAFFVFPPPPPYPSYPVHPGFPPRYPPSMEPFPPQRNQGFHPQMRPPHYPRPYGPTPPAFSSGLVYSSNQPQPTFVSGPLYTSNQPQPTYSYPTASVSNTSFTPQVASTPVSARPIVKSKELNLPVSATSVSNGPVYKFNASVSTPVSMVTAQPAPPLVETTRAPPLVVTASVAPTVTPVHSHSPPPPYNGETSSPGPRRFNTGHGEVTLTVSECEIFNLLSSVDPNAAHWYMVDAISRAMSTRTTDSTHNPVATPQADCERSAASRLNPEANEFRSSSLLRPPPGFNGD